MVRSIVTNPEIGVLHDQISDEELLRQFVRGDTAALGLLAARHERALLGLAAALFAPRRELALDAVQETWMRVIHYADSFRNTSSFKTWLYRILLSRCRALAAGERGATGAARARSSREFRPGEPGPAEAPWAAIAPPDDQPEDLSELRSLVAALPVAQRDVVLLCYHAQMTHSDAAAILEIRLGTLKSRLHAALTTLRRKLGERVGT